MWRAAFLIVFVGAAAGASFPQAGATPIPWSSKRSLAWTDYIAKPELTSEIGALTTYQLTYLENCALDKYSFTVTSVFQPAQSWVKPAVVSSPEASRRVLVHEQGHFDLSEVSARTLRKALAELKHPCGMTSEERHAVVRWHLAEDLKGQLRYDAATGYGVDEAQQTQQVTQIARMLSSLAEFAADK